MSKWLQRNILLALAVAILVLGALIYLTGCAAPDTAVKYPGPLECVWWENGSLTTGHCS